MCVVITVAMVMPLRDFGPNEKNIHDYACSLLQIFPLFLTSNLLVCMYVTQNNKQLLQNACYRSVQSLLSSRLLSRNVKVKIYKTIILPVVLYGCETLSLMLREEHRLRVFEKQVS
jgi:hypothetical protein